MHAHIRLSTRTQGTHTHTTNVQTHGVHTVAHTSKSFSRVENDSYLQEDSCELVGQFEWARFS